MDVGEWLEIIQNHKIGDKIYKMVLASKKISKEANPGQFIHILCDGKEGALLRRPFSLSDIDRNKNEISIVYRVQGKGTRNLRDKIIGDKIHSLGPLGKGFSLNPSYNNVAIVAGGMGTAPLMELVKYYRERSRVYLGFEKDPILLEEIKGFTEDITSYSEKGDIGKRGLVTEELYSKWSDNPPQIVYTCGPRPMMEEVALICNKLNIPCQLSMEERMACGIGACLVCSCKTNKKDQKNEYTRVCKEGPVYWGSEVVWNG